MRLPRKIMRFAIEVAHAMRHEVVGAEKCAHGVEREDEGALLRTLQTTPAGLSQGQADEITSQHRQGWMARILDPTASDFGYS